jgi:hypothetical protein
LFAQAGVSTPNFAIGFGNTKKFFTTESLQPLAEIATKVIG